MYRIVNLDTRAVLTYRDAAPITYGSEELARHHAMAAQDMTDAPHAVLHITESVLRACKSAPAPWFK